MEPLCTEDIKELIRDDLLKIHKGWKIHCMCGQHNIDCDDILKALNGEEVDRDTKQLAEDLVAVAIRRKHLKEQRKAQNL